MTEHIPFTLTDDPRWLLTFDGFDPTREAQIEAVCALVNGYQGTRAAMEEGHPASRPATFIAGIFNTPVAPQAAELEEPIPELVVVPDWSRLRLLVAGAELRLDRCELLDQRRTLDLRQGALLRTWRLRDAEGRITAVTSLRFASLADRRALGQFLTITPENYGGELSVELLLDGRVTNEQQTPHLAPVYTGSAEDAALLVVRTARSGYTIAAAARSELLGAGQIALRREMAFVAEGAGACVERFSWEAEAGRTYALHKLVALATSREEVAPAAAATARVRALWERGPAVLLREHTSAWAERWHGIDASIPGDAELQRQVRFACYHLVGAASPDDERSSIGARALTGERYRGHVFWDTEIFVWPALLYTHPATARALLMYRYHTLAGARAKAAASGYRGAMYPWEAADTGEEVTPAYMLSGGQRVPVLTGIEEHHIAADVALAVLQYGRATGDRAFMRGPGAEIVLDVARFWASRAEAGAEGAYHIRRVIGPDEYHETVDDNAYTNGLAAHILRAARALAADLARQHPERWRELADRLALDDAELALWEAVAAGLVTGYDPATGLVEQFAGYHQLDPIDLTGHDPSVATVDAKLGWYPMQRTKVLKQADVIMLLILLWEQYPLEAHAANFAYYEPKTSHDSSLSYSFHALFAARLGKLDLAESYLRRAALIDLDLTRQGHAGASGGVHIAALGGIWQALALGFLGMQPEDEGLRFTPHIPAGWGELAMPIAWRGARLRVRASADGGLILAVEQGGPVRVATGAGPWLELGAGEQRRLS
ncbi:MAG: glycoside hydrolase family 65 protein [Chloroflexi bacterium OHK40]